MFRADSRVRLKGGLVLLGLGLGTACQSGSGSAGLDRVQAAALVAALAVSESGDDGDSGLAGAEPLWVGGCNADRIVLQVIERLDTDRDGSLGLQEVQAVSDALGSGEERLALLVATYDINADGSVDTAELVSFEADLESRCEGREATLLARFDEDGDGQLNAVESQAAREAIEARSGMLRRRAEQADAGMGGRFGQRPLDFRQRRARASAELDTNGSGTVDGLEPARVRGHWRACVRGERPVEPVPPASVDDPGAGLR